MSQKQFELHSPYPISPEQNRVVSELVDSLNNKVKEQTLLGVTGSGKTFTMANIISKMGKSALVLSHNKTLAAQLASEFKTFFPQNAVEYFVSYYDYYQPEAYLPTTDTFIEKDSSINDNIDRLRHSATHSLLTRKDVIVVASVSCIYGLGAPQDYDNLRMIIEVGQVCVRKSFIQHLLMIRYERNDVALKRGCFRVRGDVIDIIPAYEDNKMLRIEWFGEEIETIRWMDVTRSRTIKKVSIEILFPASHYVIPEEKMNQVISLIRKDLLTRLKFFEKKGYLLEYERLKKRTNYDLEMMQELGYCSGIENYSRYFSGRHEGEPPFVLLDFFDKDILIFIDESHVTVPQIGAMYKGDRSRKMSLVEHGFRLPSAIDNRPLQFKEFEQYLNSVIYVSATPGSYEYEHSQHISEQIIRPTGLLDPKIDIRPLATQVDDLVTEIIKQIEMKERTLVTTLTKKMAEKLSTYLKNMDIKAEYIHSETKTLDRLKILKELRIGRIDVLVGVNLLREGLDLPEVSLVAILDADKEGFLRNAKSLIQTMGRAARHKNGRVVLYADKQTKSIQRAVQETERRRSIQEKYNKDYGIIPRGVEKNIIDLMDTSEVLSTLSVAEEKAVYTVSNDSISEKTSKHDSKDMIVLLEKGMKKACNDLNFELAIDLREQIKKLKKQDH